MSCMIPSLFEAGVMVEDNLPGYLTEAMTQAYLYGIRRLYTAFVDCDARRDDVSALEPVALYHLLDLAWSDPQHCSTVAVQQLERYP